MDADVIVVGGGASGLFAATIAAKRGRKVLILEQKDKLGKKILATGNGKCNFTNQFMEREHFRGEDTSFAWRVLQQFDNAKTIEAMRRMGVEPKNKNGYYYPASEQAVSVLEALRQGLIHSGARIRTGERVKRVHKERGVFTVEVEGGARVAYSARSVILSTGGCAQPKLGSDGSGYGLAESLGHRVVTPLPALTGLKVREKFIKSLAGVRVEARISILDKKPRKGGEPFQDESCKDGGTCGASCYAEEVGELQLVKYGISGIPVFQVSRFASKALWEGREVVGCLDFFPHITVEALSEKMRSRVEENGYQSMGVFLMGLMNDKLARVLVQEAGVSLSQTASEVYGKQEAKWKRLLHKMKRLEVTITEPVGFEMAQVTAGGVCTNEVNPNTMESKLVENLYVTGELLDIDGTCGGYNLQWAWSTGYVAGSKI